MRLNRFLAAAGFGSRRACEKLITEGKVSVNGHFLRELATQVEAGDDVRVRGRRAQPEAPRHVVLHKPRGFLCTRADEKGRRTIFDLLPPHFGTLFPVGRLDKESEGLLLLTNDGALSQRLTHPSHEVEKEYEVLLDKPFDLAEKPKFLRGFPIEGGRAKVERLVVVKPKFVKVVLRQGIKRQIRLMFYKHGYEVKRLLRSRIGGLELRGLQAGEWRQLTARQVAMVER